MVMIETDILIALSSKTDKHHNEVKRLLEKLKVIKLSPHSLTELDLLITSKNLIVKSPDFYNALKAVFAYYGVSIMASRPNHFARAWTLRRKYGLTFFDSLHAATAMEEDETLVSFDRKYMEVEELKYEHPSSIP